MIRYLVTGIAIIFLAPASWALVDTKNANYSQSWIDLELPGAGYDLKVQRTYNSRTLYEGIFGFGWCSNFETSLSVAAQSVTLTECGAGQETVFTMKAGKAGQEGARYESNNNNLDVITFTKGYFQRSLPDGSLMRFNPKGEWLALFDRNGNFIKSNYSGGLIRGIEDNNGRKLTFSYYPQGKKIKSIIGPNGIKIDYVIKGVDLVAVTNAWKKTYTYDYDDLHNLDKITFPDKTTIKIKYDKERDWVVGFTDRENCFEDYKYELSKKTPKEHYWVNITKTCGKRIVNQSKHEFWFKSRANGEAFMQRILSIINENLVDITYHEEFNKPVRIQRGNTIYTYDYNSKGQVIKKTTPEAILKYQYDDPAHAKVTKLEIESLNDKGGVVAKRILVYGYDKKLNLNQAKDSEGRLIDLRHDDQGRITYVKDHTKKVVEVSYDNKFNKPKTIERKGLGKVVFTYKDNGEVDKIQSKEGTSVAMQVAVSFNNMIDMIGPVSAEIY